MSKMKMSDAFKLPLKSEGWIVYSESYEIDWILEPQVDELECGSKKEAEYTAHAINNHDRMVEEIAELKGAIEAAVRIKELWLPMVAFSDSPPEHYAEIEALHNMANKFEKALAKLNQEGEE